MTYARYLRRPSLALWIWMLLRFAGISPGSIHAQTHFTPEERRIITITDERRNADSLLGYLSSATVKIARRAAIGIGNIGDTSIRPALLKYFLAEQRDSVAEAEAFALGLLGPDAGTSRALTENSRQHPTKERLKAIARTAPKSDSASAAEIVHQLAEEKKIDPSVEADAYVAFALHHVHGPAMMNDLDEFTGNNDPSIRWRAAYAFARGDDSLDLASRFPKLKELLLDQGSSYARMFAAAALGKLHDGRAGVALARAYRGEEEWRVRVNILRAFSQFPKLDSLTMETLELAVDSAFRDSTLAIQVGLTAGDVIDRFVTSGTLTKSDSVMLQTWLDGFSGTDSRHEEVALVVSACLTVPAARLQTPTTGDAIRNYSRYQNPVIRDYAVGSPGTELEFAL